VIVFLKGTEEEIHCNGTTVDGQCVSFLDHVLNTDWGIIYSGEIFGVHRFEMVRRPERRIAGQFWCFVEAVMSLNWAQGEEDSVLLGRLRGETACLCTGTLISGLTPQNCQGEYLPR
jgi:hypothetical protein